MKQTNNFKFTELYVGLLDGSVKDAEVVRTLESISNSYALDMLKFFNKNDINTFMTLLVRSVKFEANMNGLNEGYTIVLTPEQIEDRAKNIALINDISIITARRIARKRATRLATPYFVKTNSIENGYFIL